MSTTGVRLHEVTSIRIERLFLGNCHTIDFILTCADGSSLEVTAFSDTQIDVPLPVDRGCIDPAPLWPDSTAATSS